MSDSDCIFLRNLSMEKQVLCSCKYYRKTAIILLLLGLIEAIISAVYAYVIRSDLSSPGLSISDPANFNLFITIQDQTMIYLAAYPICMAMIVWIIPIMLKSRELLLPRLVFYSAWGLIPIAVMSEFIRYLTQQHNVPEWAFYSTLSSEADNSISTSIFTVAISTWLLIAFILITCLTTIIVKYKNLRSFSIRALLLIVVFICAAGLLGSLLTSLLLA